ncbi:hypothetical protein GPJ59_35330, partial [Streptomyces bambusae]|nr:hypothetical protein [Streptomyces bambusae]
GSGAGGGSGASAGIASAARTAVHLAARPHVIRSERTPVTPGGSRRPSHTERADVVRTRGASAARPVTGG